MDTLVQGVLDSRTGSASTAAQASAPIVELMSQYAGSGKTHLLYHLTALAVLPFNLGGRQAAVLYFDLDNHFSVPRLAQQIKRLALAYSQGDKSMKETSLKKIIGGCLRHVHIFRPSSLASTIHTFNNLSTYLFNQSEHHSFDRAIAFIAIDSASAFYWQTRVEADQAALMTITTRPGSEEFPPPQPVNYTILASALKLAYRTFLTPIIYTARDYNPPQQTHMPSAFVDAFSYRPCLPQLHPTLRFVIRRADVRKLPAEISLEDTMRENEIRRKVVALGKFECFVNEWGIEEKVMEKLRVRGAMFDVFITKEGVKVGDGPE